MVGRPPSEEDVRRADASHPGWRASGEAWRGLLCGLCTSPEFLAHWDDEHMTSCRHVNSRSCPQPDSSQLPGACSSVPKGVCEATSIPGQA